MGKWFRLGLYSGDVSYAVCDVVTLGQVEQHEGIAEWVRHDSDAADGNVEGLSHYPAARRRHGCSRLVSRGDKPVRLVGLLRG